MTENQEWNYQQMTGANSMGPSNPSGHPMIVPQSEPTRQPVELPVGRPAMVPRAELEAVEAELGKEREKRESLQATFDLRWNADMRAIKMWQEKNPGNDDVWPDHADLVVWLMEQLEGARLDAVEAIDARDVVFAEKALAEAEKKLASAERREADQITLRELSIKQLDKVRKLRDRLRNALADARSKGNDYRLAALAAVKGGQS